MALLVHRRERRLCALEFHGVDGEIFSPTLTTARTASSSSMMKMVGTVSVMCQLLCCAEAAKPC